MYLHSGFAVDEHQMACCKLLVSKVGASSLMHQSKVQHKYEYHSPEVSANEGQVTHEASATVFHIYALGRTSVTDDNSDDVYLKPAALLTCCVVFSSKDMCISMFSKEVP